MQFYWNYEWIETHLSGQVRTNVGCLHTTEVDYFSEIFTKSNLNQFIKSSNLSRFEVCAVRPFPGRTVRAPVLVWISAWISVGFPWKSIRITMLAQIMRQGYPWYHGLCATGVHKWARTRDGTDDSTRISMVTRISLRISARTKHGPFEPGF